MKRVSRSDLLDYQTYAEKRDEMRSEVLEQKRPRRIHVGPYLTFLFENFHTVRYQVQEMMRVEQIVRESDIEHEIETYNELLGAPGELGCTLLIEIDDAAARDELLRAWTGLNEHLYVEVEGGDRIAPTYDARQVGEGGRLSSVQYLKFDLGGRAPVAVGCSMKVPQLEHRLELDATQRAALTQDLS